MVLSISIKYFQELKWAGLLMAEKILKTRTQISSTLKNEIYSSLQKYSKDSNIPISKILDMAVSQYLLSQEKHKDK
jgi:hypothetical protein